MRNNSSKFASQGYIEPPHGKTNNLHMQKQRRRSASQNFTAFVFARRIVHFLYFLNPKLSSVIVQPGLCPTCSETTLLVPRGGSLKKRLCKHGSVGPTVELNHTVTVGGVKLDQLCPH